MPTLPVIQAPLACATCPCIPGARVGCTGNPKARIVIVVDGPGTAALKARLPLANEMEALVLGNLPTGVDLYRDTYIVGATQCRMPVLANQQRAKEFRINAVQQCRSRALSQIWEHPRDLVIAMGAAAAISVTGDTTFKITQRRGEVLNVTDPIRGNQVRVYPILHPGYLLKGGNLQTFRIDLAEAFKLAKTGVSRQEVWKPPAIQILDTPEAIWKIAQELADEAVEHGWDYNLIAGDFETSGFSPTQDYILDFGFYRRKDDTAYLILPELMEDPAYKLAVRYFMLHPEIRWIWQNGKFDIRFAWCKDWIPYGTDIIHEDTLLLSYTLNETARQHDLDEISKNRLGAPEHKQEIKQWVKNKKDSYSKIPILKRHEYLAKDLKKTDQNFRAMRDLVAADIDTELLYTHTLIPLSAVLCEIELYGIAVDLEYVRINHYGATQADVDAGRIKQEDLESEIGLVQEIQQCSDALSAVVGYPVNPNSPAQVKHLLYEVLGLKIKGKVPTDTAKETLDKLPPHPAVKLIRQYRSLVKMLSTYVVAIERRHINGRIHTTFKLHITPTGRLSSSEPNVQNIPRVVRWKRMYCSSAGRVLVEADYNTAELRALAALSKDVALTEIFLDGKRNLHDEVATDMYGADFTDYQRIRAKAINFGIPYGREAYSIAMEFDITPEEAQRLINTWFARFPQAAAFLKWARSRPRHNEPLITVFGRKRRPGIVSGERLHGLMNEFANFNMQSLISDFNLHSAKRMQPLLKKCGAHIVNLVHDSALTECPDKEPIIRDVRDIMLECMEDTPKIWLDTPIIFKVDFKVGTHWGMLNKLK